MTARRAQRPPLFCRDCPMWYGGEDDGWGPCSIKHRRGDTKYLTWGGHACDEEYTPPSASPSPEPAAGTGPAPGRLTRHSRR
jgi:hypothetical protein